MVIYNDRLAKVLERLKVAVRNARDSYGRGPRYEKFAERLKKTMERLESE